MIKLDILQHMTAWTNFGRVVKDRYGFPDQDDLNIMLEPYNAKWVEDSQDILFNTERDLAFFVLKWS
jgi:hypothetical protein